MINEFGWIGTGLTLVYKIPQIIEIIKRRKIDGISIRSYELQSIGCTMYIIHGYQILDKPIMVMGIVTLGLNIIMMIIYYYIKRIEIAEEIKSKEGVIL
jgi:uncharacterized protein with PQ loop repeat